MLGMGGSLKWIACMVTGGTALGGMTYGGIKVAGGGQPTYTWGNKYCVTGASTRQNCIILGPIANEGFNTKGVWLRQGFASTGDLAVEDTTGFTGSFSNDFKELFEKFPGLKGFIERTIGDFKNRGCTYTSAAPQSTGLEYKVTCTQGSP
ncbi:hypothetical protein MHLP_04075 [Candidatus Mycoplasma haematolamae str. Purdue]|uniref:Uncharacterized protein n=1 Tax=Mycoplasma haematolamae (strain Purdue) TaxID=1212765 RepID=I7BAP4_MYCHA|nr:hypothetical protein [Candidatus Mycoplasma haematolamae]AFO52395.1 hypothetical protein MHLP_04075 [Candidatus Mycoplasma haematolamae str. Purdue]